MRSSKFGGGGNGSSTKKRKGPARASLGYYNKLKNAGGAGGGNPNDGGGYSKQRTGPSRTRVIPGFNEQNSYKSNLGGQTNRITQGGNGFSKRLDNQFNQQYPVQQVSTNQHFLSNSAYGGGLAPDYGAYANINQLSNGAGLSPNLPSESNLLQNAQNRDWDKAPVLGYLSPDQLNLETNDQHANMYPKLKTSITFNSNGSQKNTDVDVQKPFMLLGVAWYWWAAVIGGFLLIILGIGVFFYFRIYKVKKRQKKKLEKSQSEMINSYGGNGGITDGSVVTGVNSFTTTESFSSSNSSTKKQRLADFVAQTDGNVVSSKGRVSLSKNSNVPFNPEGTSMPMNHPSHVKTRTLAGNETTNTFQNLNYDNMGTESVFEQKSVFGECYNQVNPTPVRAVRTLRRSNHQIQGSPILNEMYEDVNLPQMVQQNSSFSSVPMSTPYDNVGSKQQLRVGLNSLSGYF